MRRPLEDGAVPRASGLPSPVDVLEHHDRVVHDEAEGHREPHEGQDVEGESREVDQVERDEDRRRDGGEDHDRGPERPEEEEEHAEDHDDRNERTAAQVGHLPADLPAFVPVQDEARVGRIAEFDGCQTFLHPVGNPHRIGADFLGDQHVHRRTRVDPVVAADVLVGVAHDSDVRDPDDAPAVGLHDGAADVLGGHGPVPDRHRPLPVAVADRAGFAHQVQVGQLPVHFVRRDPHRGHQLAVQLDLQQTLAAPVRRDQRNPFDPAQFGNHHVVEVFAQGFERPRAGEGVAQQPAILGLAELVGDIRLDDDTVHARRKLVFLQGREPFREVEAREVHVHVARELDPDGRAALGRLRHDLFDTLDQLDGRLQRRGEERFDRLGRGAPPGGLDSQPGQLGVGHQLDRDILPRAHAEKRDGNVPHRDRHRPPHAQLDHGVPAFCTTRPSSGSTTPRRPRHLRRTSSITE